MIIHMKDEPREFNPPAILAPAGNKASFLAALAAGADEIYCGLKQFSARMEAKNFSLEELSALTRTWTGQERFLSCWTGG